MPDRQYRRGGSTHYPSIGPQPECSPLDSPVTWLCLNLATHSLLIACVGPLPMRLRHDSNVMGVNKVKIPITIPDACSGRPQLGRQNGARGSEGAATDGRDEAKGQAPGRRSGAAEQPAPGPRGGARGLSISSFSDGRALLAPRSAGQLGSLRISCRSTGNKAADHGSPVVRRSPATPSCGRSAPAGWPRSIWRCIPGCRAAM